MYKFYRITFDIETPRAFLVMIRRNALERNKEIRYIPITKRIEETPIHGAFSMVYWIGRLADSGLLTQKNLINVSIPMETHFIVVAYLVNNVVRIVEIEFDGILWNSSL